MADHKHEPCCSEHIIHPDRVAAVRQALPQEDTLIDLAEVFKVFGDSTRIKILSVLMEEEMCVCDIAELLGMGQSAISHQLRILRNVKLIKSRRDGKSVFYSLDDEHVRSIFHAGLEHVLEQE